MNENRNLKKGVGIHARRFIAYVVLASDLIDSNSVLPDFKASRISDDPLSALGDFCRILKSGDLSAERISATKKPAGFF